MPVSVRRSRSVDGGFMQPIRRQARRSEHPRAFPRSAPMRMASRSPVGFGAHSRRRVGELDLHVVEAGPPGGRPAILLHGFPEFWYGWRHQLGPLAAAGLRVVAPDQRGYNLSDKPQGLQSYTLDRLAGDVVALADALGCDRVSLVGHDWGGLVAWWTAARHGKRVERLAILNAPHPQAFGPYLRRHPTQLLRSAYIGFFQLPWLAEGALAAADFALLRRALTGSSRPGTFTAADLERYKRAWAEPGALTAMLAWYRALRLRRTTPAEAARIRCPTACHLGPARPGAGAGPCRREHRVLRRRPRHLARRGDALGAPRGARGRERGAHRVPRRLAHFGGLGLVPTVQLQRLEESRDHVVAGDRRGELDEAPVVEGRADRGEDLVRHADVARHRVRIGKHGALPRIEQIRALPVRQCVELRLRQALPQRDRRVLFGLVGGAVDDRDAHDDELAQVARQRALLTDRREAGEPAGGDRRAVQQHPVEMQHAAALGRDAPDDVLDLGPIRIGVRDAGHVILRQRVAAVRPPSTTISVAVM